MLGELLRGLFDEDGVFGVVDVVEFDGAVHIYWKETNITYISETYNQFYSQIGYPKSASRRHEGIQQTKVLRNGIIKMSREKCGKEA